MNLEGVDKAGIWSLMHWSNKRVVLTCSSHRKNMACGTTCRWVKSSGTAELQSYMNWCKASGVYMDSAIYRLKKCTPQPLEPAHGAYRVAHQGLPCPAAVALMASKRRSQPAATGRVTSVSENSPGSVRKTTIILCHSNCCLKLKITGSNRIPKTLSTGAILHKRPWHKENCVSNILEKKTGAATLFLTNHTN